MTVILNLLAKTQDILGTYIESERETETETDLVQSLYSNDYRNHVEKQRLRKLLYAKR